MCREAGGAWSLGRGGGGRGGDPLHRGGWLRALPAAVAALGTGPAPGTELGAVDRAVGAPLAVAPLAPAPGAVAAPAAARAGGGLGAPRAGAAGGGAGASSPSSSTAGVTTAAPSPPLREAVTYLRCWVRARGCCSSTWGEQLLQPPGRRRLHLPRLLGPGLV